MAETLAQRMYRAQQAGNALGDAAAERAASMSDEDYLRKVKFAGNVNASRALSVAEARRQGSKLGLDYIRGLASQAATGATTVDRAHADALRGRVAARNASLMGRATDADRGFASGYDRSAAMGAEQVALGDALAARAMGGGPSAAGFQALAQRDQVARQMAGAGGSLLAQRAAMGWSGDVGAGLAAQAAQARAGEVAGAQSVAASNLGAGMGQNVGAQRMMFGRDVARQQLTDADMFTGYDLQQQAAMANAGADEAMRQRLYRLRLYELGSKQAAEAQALQQRGAQIQAASTAATAAFGAGAGALGDWIKQSSAEEKARAANGQRGAV